MNINRILFPKIRTLFPILCYWAGLILETQISMWNLWKVLVKTLIERFIYLLIYLFIYLFIYLSIYLFSYIFFIYLFVYLFIYLFIHLFVSSASAWKKKNKTKLEIALIAQHERPFFWRNQAFGCKTWNFEELLHC